MLLEGKAIGRRITDTKLDLGGRLDAAIGEIASRLGAGARGERRLEESGGELENVVQGLAPMLLCMRLVRHLRHRYTGVRGEPLNRLRERHPLAHHDKVEDVAVLAGREIVEEALLVIDRE